MSRRDRQRRRRRNRGSPLGRVIALTAVLVVAVIAVGGIAVAGWVINVAHSAPNLSSKPTSTPGSPSQVFAANGSSMGYILTPDIHQELTYAQMPKRIRQATVSIEDRRFYQHGALDYEGIIRAAFKDALNGSTALQGASTLTEQLVDNAYLPKSLDKDRAARNLKYKIEQAKLAQQLESRHSKDWILGQYLNVVPYGTYNGEEAYGVGAASEMFFDKPIEHLSLDEAALLAGLPQAPSEYNPFIHPKAARYRRNQVLRAMVTSHDISPGRARAAMRRPLRVKPDLAYTTRTNPYVFDYVEQQLEHDLCPRQPKNCATLQHGGLKIYTTIDLKRQAQADRAIASNESTRAEQNPAGVAAAGLASIDVFNGHVLAIATSGKYGETKFNYATQAFRQTGSAFKVFALMELIHDYDGNPNDTYYTSQPLAAGWLSTDPTWEVHTDDDVYNGNISITHATTISDNTVFAQLAVDLGIPKLDQMAHEMGITSPLTGNPSEVLGGLKYGVTPLQMADAYATIADGGVHHPATIIDKVVFPNGRVLNFGDAPGTRVFPYNQTYEADQVLKTVLTSPGATGYGLSWGCPAAGKTGTANDLANAWFVGFTPRISTGVWVGYPEGNLPMEDGFGGALAGPIWKNYMEYASNGYCGDWSPPSVPFEGTAFDGAHTASGPSPPPATGETTTTSSTTSSTTTSTSPTTTPAPTTGQGGGSKPGAGGAGGAGGASGLTGSGTG